MTIPDAGGARVGSSARAGVTVDAWLAVLAVLVLGCGVTIVAAGTAHGSLTAAAVGGGLMAVALIVLIAGGWVDGLVVAALAVPLPAVLEIGDLRVAAAAPASLAVVAGWLLGRRSTRPPLPDLRHVHTAAFGLLAALTLATVFASSIAVSARELTNMTLLLGFFLLALDRARDTGASNRLIGVFITLAAVCGVFALLEMVGVLPGAFPRWGTPYNRAALGFGQPNGLGVFLAISLPLTVHGVRVSKGAVRATAAFALLACAAGLFATFSRGSWLAVLGGAGALILVRDWRLLVHVAVGALILGVLLELLSGGMLTDTVQRTLTDWAVEQRAGLMLVGVLMFVAHPIVGVGPGGFAVELGTFGPQIPELWDYLPTPHNAYIQMAAETGIIGLLAYVAFLAACLIVLVRRANLAAARNSSEHDISLRRCLLWSFATACCVGMVVWPFAHGTGQAVLLLLAAGLAAR